MKIFQLSIFIFFLLSFSLPAKCQQLKENEVVVIQGEKYVLHQVRTGETIYSITRDFKLNQSQLLENNPQISTGLDIGEILKIPYREDVKPPNIPILQKGDPTGFIQHVVESRKETPYFIAKRYGITVEEIFAYNPDVRRIKKGMELRIPTWTAPVKKEEEAQQIKTEIASENNETKMREHEVVSRETLYSIAKKYGVSESEILFINPDAKNLRAGSKIYLPVGKTEAKPKIDSQENYRTTDYFQHTISSGETMWGITHKFNVSDEELVALNPVLKTAFPAGVVIKIPLNKKSEPRVIAATDDAFMYVPIKQNETLYSLAEKYNLTIPDIRKFNPQLEDRNPVLGEMVLIPNEIELNTETPTEIANAVEPVTVNETEAETEIETPVTHYEVEVAMQIPEGCVPGNSPIFTNEKYDVALFLPLYLEANDALNRETVSADVSDLLNPDVVADTLIEKEEPKGLFKQFYGNSENFLQFYEGVLLAVDSMRNAGMTVKLHVYDTQNNVDSVRKFLNTDEFLETDLIIGPVYPNVQEVVARVSAKNRIPMVSPFTSSSEMVQHNSQVYQINPTREYIAQKTAEMIAEEYYNSNFIVVKNSAYEGIAEGDLVKLIEEKFFNSGYLNGVNGVRFSIYNFKNEGPSGLRRIMSHDKENVVFIPSSVEGELSVAISNLNNLADDYSITLIGSGNYQQRFPSIDVAQFHNLKLKYVYPFWTDYSNPATIEFVEKFKKIYYTEPNNFGIQGFDAAFYFLNAMNYFGKDFQDCLPYFHVNLVQGNYHFEKVSQFGGFMNKGVSVIDYHRDYTVHRERVKGQPKLVAGN